MGSPPSSTCHPYASPKKSDLINSQKSSVPHLKNPSSSSLDVAPPTSALTSDESPTPDPRWPSKCRWSAPKKPPPTKSVTIAPGTSDAPPALAVSQGQAEPPLKIVVSVQTSVTEIADASSIPSMDSSKDSAKGTVFPLCVSATETKLANESDVTAHISNRELVGASPNPSTSLKKGTISIPILDLGTKSAPSHSLAGQRAWAQPKKLISPTSLSSDKGEIAGNRAGSLSSALWPSLSDSHKGKASQVESVRISYKEVTKTSQNQTKKFEDDLRFPWAARMNPISRNLYRATEPEYLADGTPKVTIPQNVLLHGLENQKEYVIGQFYRCSLPPGGLIFAVFNKLWGRKCRISIRKLGESNYLFHIPDEATRIWVLQRGLWHVDDCLMFVAPWTPEATLAIPEIKTIPVWVTLKKIPNICYSIPGISHIASGLGAPMATHKPRLDPILMGEAKILVEVELSKAFPPRIAASDEKGFISMVDVEYAWLPTNCSRCGQLGHKIKRCLQTVTTNEVEDVNVTRSIVSDPVITSEASAPIQATTTEVDISTNIVLPIEESFIIVTDPVSHVTEQASATIETVLPGTTTVDNFESPLPEIASVVPFSTSTHSHGSNRFASLASSEVEDGSLDPDNESVSMDLMTPSGQRILRDRPVKPSAKAQEMIWQVAGGGRGNRGRGKRGGRG